MSTFVQSTAGNKSNINCEDDDWVDAIPSCAVTTPVCLSSSILDPNFHTLSASIDTNFIHYLFPNKPQEKIKKWIMTLQVEEIETLRDLDALDPPSWEALNLPLAVKAVLKNHVLEIRSDELRQPEKDITITSNPQKARPISQIDIIVIDISCSMKSRSKIDVDKTREDVSKMLFHTLIDKLMCLELSHVVGLIAFGENVTPINITTEYEKFHDELGRLDANECSTKLYDSIFSAAEMIEMYLQDNQHFQSLGPSCDDSESSIMKRIFVLTDGDDNSSKKAPWQVAQFLQQRKIVLDAIPVAGLNKVLYSMCRASGGFCFDVVSQEQGMNLFEREATLHVAYREVNCEVVPDITDMSILRSLEPTFCSTSSSQVVDIKSVVPKTVFSPCLTATQVESTMIKNVSTTGTNESRGTMKRIMGEYFELQKSPIDGVSVYVNADDTCCWKVALKDLPTPYEGGIWLITIDFPRDYPFHPPKFKFITPIFHCNVSPDGHICLDELQSSWSPAMTISKSLQSIKSLLLSPNANDPLDAYKAALYRDYINDGSPVYFQQASNHTLIHAGQETFDSFIAKYYLS